MGANSTNVDAFLGFYKGCCSPDFQALWEPMTAKKSNPLSIFRSRSMKDKESAANPEVCCVLCLPERYLSLIFDCSSGRNEFAETVAWYAQQIKAGKVKLP